MAQMMYDDAMRFRDETVQNFEAMPAAAQNAFDAELLRINKAYQDGAVTHMIAALDGLADADEERRALAYQALRSAQAYLDKDDAPYELSQTGNISDLSEDMLIKLLALYPELASLIDETTGRLKNDFETLSPVLQKARLTYADYLHGTLDTVTLAKENLAKGLFDPAEYSDLIEQMRLDGFDLVSVLGGADGTAQAQRMLTAFFDLYNARLEETAGGIGTVAESWADTQRKSSEAAAAEKNNDLDQLQSLRNGGSIADWNNQALADGFAKAYPEIAACLDETGKFSGGLEKLDEAIRMVHFSAFETAGDKLSSLRAALQALSEGSAYDAVSELPEEYQARVLPLLNDQIALETWLTEEIARQETAQKSAWTAMTGGAQGYEAVIRGAVNTTDDLTKAIESAKAALLDKSFSQMEREGGYTQLRGFYDHGKIEGFHLDMFERLLELYPKLVNRIDRETDMKPRSTCWIPSSRRIRRIFRRQAVIWG